VTIAESIAGSVGESLFLPGEAWRATNDSVQERALASLVASSPESIEAFVEFYAVEAVALLRPHEHIMRAFTKEVLRRRTMTDADNDEVIAASVAAKSIEDEQMKISAGPTGNASSNRPRLSLIYCRSVHNIRIGTGGPVCAVASGIGRKAVMAHLGRHVGFDPDHSANAARPCAPSHYGSCGPSKSLSKRKCFTLRP
jgi:hypothetical protein